MSETVIERCAHALVAEYERQVSSGEVVHKDNGDIQLNASSLVRAVIAALRETNPAIIDAGNKAMREAWAVRGMSAPAVAGDAAVDATWQAMLDAALEED